MEYKQNFRGGVKALMLLVAVLTVPLVIGHFVVEPKQSAKEHASVAQ